MKKRFTEVVKKHRFRAALVVGERVSHRVRVDLVKGCGEVLKPGARVHRTIDAGFVAVDWARLMFVDVDALDSWRHDESVDGKADFVFWGRDAAQLAKKIGAKAIDKTEFGWKNREFEEALEFGQHAEDVKSELGLKLATDFRPHSDHWRLLRKMRASSTGSATVTLGKSKTCGFFTTWGDGFFPVRVGVDEDGSPVRVQIDFMRSVNS